MAFRMHEQRRYRVTRTFVWDRSVLYLFWGSMRQAKGRARWWPLTQPPGVADMPRQNASLAWMDNAPYLFKGSLTDASGRGKGYKRGMVARVRKRRRAEQHALARFISQYGNGIGEGRRR